MKRQPSNHDAMSATVDALQRTGRLENVDAALVRAALTLAEAVDRDPDNASLWREYRAVEASLRRLDGGAVDSLAAAIAELSAPVGDSEV